MPSDFYKLLGVERSATEIEIRAAYRDKALHVFPEENGETENENFFALLQEAYDTLRDPTLREKYDRTIPQEENSLSRAAVFSSPPPFSKPPITPAIYKLADGRSYVFETAPSVIRATVSNGDTIQYKEVKGTFIGLAGDDCWWWRRATADYPSKLCDPRSSMATSRIKVICRFRHPSISIKTPGQPVRELLRCVSRNGSGRASSSERDTNAETAERATAEEVAAVPLLQQLKEEIIRQSRERYQNASLGCVIREELELRKWREENLLECHRAGFSKFREPYEQLLKGVAPGPEGLERMMAEAMRPLPLYYPRERGYRSSVAHHSSSLSTQRTSLNSSREGISTAEGATSSTQTSTEDESPKDKDEVSSKKKKKRSTAQYTSDTVENVKKDTKHTNVDKHKKKKKS